MVKFDKQDLMQLLKESGFDVIDMLFPIGVIKEVAMRAMPRRVYKLENLLRELTYLKHVGVRTIGVYTVKPNKDVFVDPNGCELKEAGGVYIRWAYYAGI